ncbi:hypothetical protein EB001_22920 [bacterium]|nr:hypothetical protein [bacterium]
MDNVDGVFFISSALKIVNKSVSVYSDEERFQHTLKTIETIDKHCPSNLKYMYETSAELPNEDYLKELSEKGVKIIWTGSDPNVKHFSTVGLRSPAESLSFYHILSWFKDNDKQNVKAKRLYKISGRYWINDNFILKDKRFKDSFVYNKAADSYMPIERRNETGAHKAYSTRLFHMDYNLFDKFHGILPEVVNDCLKYGIDVEHSYWKHLHLNKFNVVELTKIGIEGWIAPLGIFEDD